ncbi:hypothetical protein [Parablautia muri]|uniref:Uncharacterized protein n=1 Tax=Parablautia muri TaxID=2320879 RepID=A0A9X5BJA2_9FIRM|nr:hypothetical protein [Parablautia muri]NBJ94682.1 hypothetical protein [Parablautia muri]
MSVNISQSYSQFYMGTEPLKSYGNGNELVKKKDTLVKYEFNTVDAQGNKVMDEMTKEEALSAMNEISAQYGDNVLVQFSGDGLKALADSIREQHTKGVWEPTEEEKAAQEKKNAEFQKEIVQLENTHRIFIPNVQTNKMLYDSLENADDKVVGAVTGIIKNYLMPHQIGDMSEKEWTDQIAFGLEQAKYLAENYLDEEHAADFLSAIETIAKYGLNGIVDKDGKVTYDIEMGYVVGSKLFADQSRIRDYLKQQAPDLYQEMEELNRNMVENKGGWGSKFIELHRRAEKVLNAPGDNGKSFYEEEHARYDTWKEKIDHTTLQETFYGTVYTDMSSFFESLKGQSSLSDAWMDSQMERFMKWLEI